VKVALEFMEYGLHLRPHHTIRTLTYQM
jgi:hypothetical protein